MAPPGNSWVDCPGEDEHFKFVKVQLKSGHVHQQVVKVACPILHHRLHHYPQDAPVTMAVSGAQ